MTRKSAKLQTTLLFALLAALAGPARAESRPTDQLTFDNLVPVEGASVSMAYIDPDADFSIYRRVTMLEPHVAFRANWQRHQGRARPRSATARDMERIKQDVATLFERVFTEKLEAAGYAVVDVAGDDVLLLKPAIIDLDITAPSLNKPGRPLTMSASTGAATLYIQLFDSVSGEILGRASDRRTVRNPAGTVSWNNNVNNINGARRLMDRWAEKLIDFLDSYYVKSASQP